MSEKKIQNLPLGTQDFEVLRSNDYLYVDKTKYVYDLITTSRVLFLSRPRRFGKSLLVSTFESVFRNKKELFDGLYIKEQTNYDWQEYPVIKLDMSAIPCSGENIKDFKKYLNAALGDIAENYQVTLEVDSAPERNFSVLINQLRKKTQKPVAILIDEYDAPLIKNISDEQKAIDAQEILKNFYSVMKSEDAHIKFLFLTGVSKFAKVSVFSGLNNLKDLGKDAKYAALLGYTQNELEGYFADRIEQLAQKENKTVSEILEKIKYWYNGYQFNENSDKVYNPFSTIYLFDTQTFSNYWFESGTPTFLIDLMKKNQYNLDEIENIWVGQEVFSVFDIKNMSIEPLLVQTGYLTIVDYSIERKDYDEKITYKLYYPNGEVKNSFLKYLSAQYSSVPVERIDTYIEKIREYLETKNIESLIKELNIFYTNIPYDVQLNYEKYYQGIFYVILKLLGISIEVEIHTNDGSIDAVIHTDDKIYIIEFKLGKTADKALAQIHKKNYAEKYQNQNKELILLGINFDMEKRKINDWKVGLGNIFPASSD